MARLSIHAALAALFFATLSARAEPLAAGYLYDGKLAEGVKALARPFHSRYRLASFGHGFMHVALATGTPIVPVAVIGAEEEAPLLANPRWLARLVGTPVAPITPALVFPFPVKYRIHFGAPMRFRGPATPEAVGRQVASVRNTLQDLIRSGLAMRRHVFF